jgi:RecB family exonuclease
MRMESMARLGLNRLTEQIAGICKEYPVDEKWLLAPSRRIGFQWLDSVTRSGQPVLNVRVKTLQHAAFDLAMSEIERQGKSYLTGVRAELIVQRIFVEIKEAGEGYFTALEPSPGLTNALLSTIRDIRLSGMKAAHLTPDTFEVNSKGLETKEILSRYEQELETARFVDYADVLRIATERLTGNPLVIPADVMLLVPEQLRKLTARLESRFLDAFPSKKLRTLPEDEIGGAPEGDVTDSDLLRWILSPTDASEPQNDGTVRIYRAVGEVNEVREVFRRCAEGGIPFDQVEILHTDGSTYVPLIYELAWRLKPDESDSIPVTFVEGIPTRYSRPGRAMSAWLYWIQNDHPQWTLVRMIQDGILLMEKADEEGFSFARLAATFKAVPIGAGASRYLPAIDAQIQALCQRTTDHESDEDDARSAIRRQEERIAGLRIIRLLVEALLNKSPKKSSNHKEVLESADWFLQTFCRCGNQFDEYSRGRLQTEIRELVICLEGEENLSGWDVWEWVRALPISANVAGAGPRPCCLYVAPLQNGGHSGRKHTFIIGLDDTRFPGAGLQDPLLLDAERSKISSDLPTASGRAAKKMEDFARLLARLRSNVTLGYCCKSLDDDREMFPSPVLISVFRILSGQHAGDQDAFLRWLPDPTSFAARAPELCSDITEWFLWRACGDREIVNAEEVIARSFPHLHQGIVAAQARQSNRFTQYDGYVPQAGLDLDPTRPDGRVLSASRLEKLGSCPMEYFFRYVLEIEPPEEYEIDPLVWLDPMQKGALLHEVFREFMARLRERDLLPDIDRDAHLMNEILYREITTYREAIPPANEQIFNATVNEFRLACQIFLQEEAVFCRSCTPLYFEAAIGMFQDGEATPLDTEEPLSLVLPDGKAVRVRGRIDRIDQVTHAKTEAFTIWDYKTGSAWGYDRKDPFLKGRRVQSALYCALVEQRLCQTHPRNPLIASFGYFFPGVREHGERISWTADQLAAGRDIIADLVEMIRTGCFPFTDKREDMKYTDYGLLYGDVEESAQATRLKMDNPENVALSPFRNLRT